MRAGREEIGVDAQFEQELASAQNEFELEAALESWLYRKTVSKETQNLANLERRVERDREMGTRVNDPLPKEKQ